MSSTRRTMSSKMWPCDLSLQHDSAAAQPDRLPADQADELLSSIENRRVICSSRWRSRDPALSDAHARSARLGVRHRYTAPRRPARPRAIVGAVFKISRRQFSGPEINRRMRLRQVRPLGSVSCALGPPNFVRRYAPYPFQKGVAWRRGCPEGIHTRLVRGAALMAGSLLRVDA